MLVYFVLGDAKVWRWGSKPMPGPNANGFASQWNIGFTILMYDLCIFLDNLLSRYLTSKGSRHHIIKSSRYFITLPFSIHNMANHESLKYVIK